LSGVAVDVGLALERRGKGAGRTSAGEVVTTLKLHLAEEERLVVEDVGDGDFGIGRDGAKGPELALRGEGVEATDDVRGVSMRRRRAFYTRRERGKVGVERQLTDGLRLEYLSERKG
jgi:hypothetical protein